MSLRRPIRWRFKGRNNCNVRGPPPSSWDAPNSLSLSQITTGRAALSLLSTPSTLSRSPQLNGISLQEIRMSRVFRVAAAQMGPNHKTASRESILARMCALLNSAADEGATLVVFPELALTNFFPRWMHDEASLQSFFEPTMPNPQVQPLFDLARERGVGFLLCYAELAEDGKRYNTSITVSTTGELLGKYRKVHLPGSYEPREGDKVNQLEKRYFTPGNLGFPAFRGDPAWHDALMGMLICNDRRWPEGWRSYALQGVELMLIGYNSAAYDPNGGDAEDEELRTFH